MTNPGAREVTAVLLRLQDLASFEHRKQFQPTRENAPGRQPQISMVRLIEELANSICAGPESGNESLKKAVQESLLEAIGVKVDIPARQFERRFNSFLNEHGSRGLIQRFLVAYLNIVTWLKLADILNETPLAPDKRRQLVGQIDSAANQKVQSITERWRLWPRMDIRRARNVNAVLQDYLFGEDGSVRKWQDFIRPSQSGRSA